MSIPWPKPLTRKLFKILMSEEIAHAVKEYKRAERAGKAGVGSIAEEELANAIERAVPTRRMRFKRRRAVK